MKITRSKLPGQKTDVVFTLNEALIKKDTAESDVPRDHKFILTGVGNQNLVVFSQLPIPLTDSSLVKDAPEYASEKIAVEGKVIQRAECRPIADDNYIRLKKLKFELQNKPRREVKQLTGVVPTYKPIRDHSFNLDHQKKIKEEGKRIRMDKDKVMDMLFSAFEKHQYYNVKDLVTITKQPITYLKEILKEICTYNMKAPHRNMWELKPEFRHYKEPAQSDT